VNGNSRFIGITSGCGGCGTSSLAIALGRILSRLKGMNVLYVTFDFMSSKCEHPGGMTRRDYYDFYLGKTINSEVESLDYKSDVLFKTVKDSYGLNYLKSDDYINPMLSCYEEIETFLVDFNIQYDLVILDIPCNSMVGLKITRLCEDIIINEGICKPFQKIYCEQHLKFLKNIAVDSKFTIFTAGFDENSFNNGDVDIHGEFGSEVRALAENLGL